MAMAFRIGSGFGACKRLLTAGAVLLMFAGGANAQAASLDEIVAAVVRVKTFINPDGRSIANLRREREGSGIVIDESGLIVTVGYLVVEAHGAEVITNSGRAVPATVIAYDPEFGFGLLRATEPLRLKPMAIGRSTDLRAQDPALVASFGGAGMVAPVHVVSRREFAGAWEYLIAGAIFTAPPHPVWSGAALIGRDGKLAGVGSLFVSDAKGGDDDGTPGNMFIPVDALMPILGDLIANGRVSGPAKPWLGVNTREIGGRLVVTRVSPQGPADKSGVRHGDVIVGVGGEKTGSLPEFYRKLWSMGAAGVTVPVEVMQDGDARQLEIPSMDRLDYFRLKSTF
jgi:S1-C subfamily serine protease